MLCRLFGQSCCEGFLDKPCLDTSHRPQVRLKTSADTEFLRFLRQSSARINRLCRLGIAGSVRREEGFFQEAREWYVIGSPTKSSLQHLLPDCVFRTSHTEFHRALGSTALMRPQLAKSLLGWEARKAPLADGMKRYYRAWLATQA